MRIVLSTAVFLAFSFFSYGNLKAQDAAPSANTDEEIRQLMEIVRILRQVNALPIVFKQSSAEILPSSLPNFQKQAALLKQLPKGIVVEIGAHSDGYYDIIFGDTLPLQPTVQRAETIRRELIRLGVNAASLSAKGYGTEKPIDTGKPNAESPKNDRIEFLVEKMPESSNKNTIVAGRGWDKIVIGATRRDIEDVLGDPEKFYEGNRLLPDPSAQYFSRGIIVVYDADSETVKSVDFIGNPAFLDAGSFDGTFRAVQAKPDKNIEWGATAAQIIAAYREPKHKLVEKRNGTEVVTLTYDQITFTLNADKLYYINVAADNNRFLAAMKREAEEKPAREQRAAELEAAATPLAYKSEYLIIAGRGAGKISLGTSRAEIEAALGQPDEFIDDADFSGIYEANYFSKGVKVEYNAKTKLATAVLFFGDTAKSKAFNKFKLFPGATDKGIRWGMSPADVIKAYGEPAKVSMRYNQKIDKDYEYINYPNVSFGFNENRLTFISNDPIWGK